MPDSRPFTTGLAAAIAGIVALGLVTAPPNVDVASSRVESHPVQLAAATTAEISTTALNTVATGLASAVTPAGLLPTSGTQLATPSQETTNAAGVPAWIGTIALRLVIAPFWYMAFPITIPVSYVLAVLVEANQPPPVTPQMVLTKAVEFFLSTPFVYAAPASSTTRTVGAAAATTTNIGAPAAASAATASEGETKPVVTKFVAPTRTVPPKLVSFAVNGGAVAGKPRISRNEPTTHSGSLRTTLKSMTSNLSNAVKHAASTRTKKAQN